MKEKLATKISQGPLLKRPEVQVVSCVYVEKAKLAIERIFTAETAGGKVGPRSADNDFPLIFLTQLSLGNLLLTDPLALPLAVY